MFDAITARPQRNPALRETEPGRPSRLLSGPAVLLAMLLLMLAGFRG
jgi:hypothetical protein